MSNLDEQNIKMAGIDAAKHTDTDTTAVAWHLNALTEALGDLSLTVDDSLSVGRGSDNDVVLGSKQVSRNHALLSVLNGKLYLKDLNSSNGTFINEERIESNKSKSLKADDTVGFASFAFQVTAPMAAAVDTTNNVEPPSKAMEQPGAPLTDSASTTIDILPTAVVEAEVIDSEVVDSEAIDAKAVDAEGINDRVASPVNEPEASPEVGIEVKPVIDSPVKPVIEKTVLDNTTVDSTVVKNAVVDNLTTENTVSGNIDKPVVKETIIEEVLSSTKSADTTPATAPEITPTASAMPSMVAEQEAVMSNDTSKETLNEELLHKEPVIDEPLVPEPTVHQEPIVTPEHDKTTKTELQEEADPDVLRAKQAATGQLSGTANLGQGRDLGTEGNNAMDQAVNNSANAGHVEKKPSGGWFIWVFIAIIIIGLALWLFNMGSV